MSDFFDKQVCPDHNVTWGECVVRHLRVPVADALEMLQTQIDEGEAILAEVENPLSEHVN